MQLEGTLSSLIIIKTYIIVSNALPRRAKGATRAYNEQHKDKH